MRVNIAVCIRMQYHECSIYADLTSVIHNRLIIDFIAADPMLFFLILFKYWKMRVEYQVRLHATDNINI